MALPRQRIHVCYVWGAGFSVATLRAGTDVNLLSDTPGVMRKTLLAAMSAFMNAVAPTTSHADNVGAAFAAGAGLLVAGPVGLVVGGVVGWIWGSPFWGPPNSPRACWIDNYFIANVGFTTIKGIASIE